MKKKAFKNGTLKSKGYFMNGDVKQEVEEAVYEGETPLSAENLNDMQNNIEEEINSVSSNLTGLINGKLENYIVTTNDSKFNDVKQIIGNDNYADGKPYLITNTPINDQNFIQNGSRHTILGMQYAEQKYGQQISFSLEGVKYRSQFNGTWKDWQCLTQNIKTGTEYETGRIIDGKKEYGKRINCGKLPDTSTTSIATNLGNVNILDYKGIAIFNQYSYKMVVGKISDYSISLAIENNQIKITTYLSAYKNYNAYVEIFYTKN